VSKGLKIIDSTMVPVYENAKGDKRINAREMHEFLESKRQFTNWIQDRIDKYGFTEGEDFFSFNKIVKRASNGGTTRTEYELTMDMAKEIAMVENNEKGRMVRRHFIEIEKRYREGRAAPVLPRLDIKTEERYGRLVIRTKTIAKAFDISEDEVIREVDRLLCAHSEHFIPSCYMGVLRFYKPEFLVDQPGFHILTNREFFGRPGFDRIKTRILLAFEEAELMRGTINIATLEPPALLEPEPQPEPEPEATAAPVPEPGINPKPARQRPVFPEKAAELLGLSGFKTLYRHMRALGMIRSSPDGSSVLPNPEFGDYVKKRKVKTKKGSSYNRIVVTPVGLTYLKSKIPTL